MHGICSKRGVSKSRPCYSDIIHRSEMEEHGWLSASSTQVIRPTDVPKTVREGSAYNVIEKLVCWAQSTFSLSNASCDMFSFSRLISFWLFSTLTTCLNYESLTSIFCSPELTIIFIDSNFLTVGPEWSPTSLRHDVALFKLWRIFRRSKLLLWNCSVSSLLYFFGLPSNSFVIKKGSRTANLTTPRPISPDLWESTSFGFMPFIALTTLHS